MKCLFGHDYRITAKGTGGYETDGLVLVRDLPMILMVCMRCGDRKVVEA